VNSYAGMPDSCTKRPTWSTIFPMLCCEALKTQQGQQRTSISNGAWLQNACLANHTFGFESRWYWGPFWLSPSETFTSMVFSCE
jgi:hypothetical protein